MNEKQCNELGCTREGAVSVTLTGATVHAPASSTESQKVICEPCAEMNARYAELDK